MKYECDFCGDEFKSKKEYLKHLNMESEMANETVLNSEDDILEIEIIIEKLKHKKAGVQKK